MRARREKNSPNQYRFAFLINLVRTCRGFLRETRGSTVRPHASSRRDVETRAVELCSLSLVAFLVGANVHRNLNCTISLCSTEDGILEATVEFYIFGKIFGLNLIEFWGFRAILMVLVVWARFFKLEWCRTHFKIWSGNRFLSFWGRDNSRAIVFCL